MKNDVIILQEKIQKFIILFLYDELGAINYNVWA